MGLFDVTINQCILTKNDCYKRGLTITPKGIMVHSTGANNPNLCRYLAPDDGLIGRNAYNNHWNMPNVEKCVHAMIGLDVNGDVQIYQTLPWNRRAWHCGASGNDTHISFEICEDDLTSRVYFEQTRDAAIELCAYLCTEYNLDPMKDGVLIDHVEGYERGVASGHSDIRHWWSKFGYTMAQFRKEVKVKMDNTPSLKELVAAELKTQLPTLVKSELDSRMSTLEATLKNRIEPIVADVIIKNGVTIADHVAYILGEREKVYNTFEELPKWAKEELKPLIDAGIIKGTGQGLALTMPLIRMLVVVWRLIGTAEGSND